MQTDTETYRPTVEENLAICFSDVLFDLQKLVKSKKYDVLDDVAEQLALMLKGTAPKGKADYDLIISFAQKVKNKIENYKELRDK